MAKNEKEQQQPKQQQPSSPSKPVSSRPINITLPPRSFTETFLSSGPPGTSGFSPGPMTLLSGFFPGSDDCKSFSQLLSGTMASPNFRPTDDKSPAGDFSRPGKLSMAPPSPMFTMPLGLSPVALPDSSGFGLFSPEVIECLYNGCTSYISTLRICTLLRLRKFRTSSCFTPFFIFDYRERIFFFLTF